MLENGHNLTFWFQTANRWRSPWLSFFPPKMQLLFSAQPKWPEGEGENFPQSALLISKQFGICKGQSLFESSQYRGPQPGVLFQDFSQPPMICQGTEG